MDGFMNEESPEINLTALIDVVFVVLIMFIIIAPLFEIEQIQLAQAGSKDVVEMKDASPITLSVTKDNKILVNKELVPLPLLPEFLKRERLKNPDSNPQLFHDKQAYFGTYQEVKNAVEIAGFDHLDVVLGHD